VKGDVWVTGINTGAGAGAEAGTLGREDLAIYVKSRDIRLIRHDHTSI
jgi:hypothetical protein